MCLTWEKEPFLEFSSLDEGSGNLSPTTVLRPISNVILSGKQHFPSVALVASTSDDPNHKKEGHLASFSVAVIKHQKELTGGFTWAFGSRGGIHNGEEGPATNSWAS